MTPVERGELDQALDDYTTAIIAMGRRCGTLPPPPTEETT